jgi:hypothetical protein
MADLKVKISELTSGTPIATDIIPYVDMADNETKYAPLSDLSGVSGFSGFSGYSGSGISGFSGFSGFSGSGISGFSGFSGEKGDSGTSGFSGYSGSGISGFSGYSGAAGQGVTAKGVWASGTTYSINDLASYSGYTWLSLQDSNLNNTPVENGYWTVFAEQGVSGFSGFSGYSGEKGGSGISGFSGYSGEKGDSGISGYSGEKGDSGFSGYSGAKGDSGVSGYSGYSGVGGGASFWTALSGTRASNTTFTVNSDVSSIIAKGVVIKWGESGTIRNGMVSIPSTYSSPNTTVTIIGDTMAYITTGPWYSLVGAEPFIAKFAIAGTIGATASGIANTYYATEPMRVIGADLQTGTAGVSGATTIDINKGGTTMFTTKPTLATTVASSPTPFTADTATSLALGDKITIDIDAVHSTTAAIDLYAQLYLFPTRYNNLT